MLLIPGNSCAISSNRTFSLLLVLADDSVSADIKLETETEDGGVGEDVPSTLSPNMYHPRRALRNAINEWLEEFSRPKAAWGPIAKPQQLITAPVPIPIIPSVNTCMSLTTTTTSCSSGSTPVVNSNQLQALAEVCSSVSGGVLLNPCYSNVMAGGVRFTSKVIDCVLVISATFLLLYYYQVDFGRISVS
jgi:protein O-GlcNAcase/histone acetyltransferase